MEITQVTPTPTKRHRGRPTGANAELQRQRILQHACQAFAEFGPDSTRLQDIAVRAQVDRRLLYHYFKSKDRLYLEVLQQIFGNLFDLSSNAVRNADSLETAVEQLMQHYYDFCLKNTNYVRMLNWENLREAKGLQQYAKQCEMSRQDFEFLRPLIENACQQNRCRGDVDPMHLILTCLGQCLLPLSFGYAFECFFNCDLTSDDGREAWIKQSVVQVLYGIRPR